LAVARVDGAVPGVEQRIVLERDDGLGHCVERAAALLEHALAGAYRTAQPGGVERLLLRREAAAGDGAGAAVDGDGRKRAGSRHEVLPLLVAPGEDVAVFRGEAAGRRRDGSGASSRAP